MNQEEIVKFMGDVEQAKFGTLETFSMHGTGVKLSRTEKRKQQRKRNRELRNEEKQRQKEYIEKDTNFTSTFID